MEDKKESLTRVITGEVRLSYAKLWEASAMEEGQKKKYGATILIPKKDKATVAKIKAAISAAEAAGKAKFGKRWNPAKLKDCLRDGDVEKPEAEEYEGMLFVSAKNTSQPGMIDRNGSKIIEKDEMYSGVYAFASLNFFPYDNVSIGVGCSLNNLMKSRDGEAFSGQTSAEEDFKGIAQSDKSFDEEEEDFM